MVVDTSGLLSHCSSKGYGIFKKVLQLLWTVDSGQKQETRDWYKCTTWYAATPAVT